MTGIEKIIEKIECDCIVACDDIISKARINAQKIMDDAENEAINIKQKAKETTEKRCLFEVEIAKSKAEHEHKNLILAAKSNIIKETIDDSIQRLKNLPVNDYFNIIIIIVEQYARKEHGIIKFSTKDLQRIPHDFDEKLKVALKESGKSVEVSNEPISIDGGFVLVYNEIEQNCTFEALINDSLDEIKDMLYNLIFMRD